MIYYRRGKKEREGRKCEVNGGCEMWVKKGGERVVTYIKRSYIFGDVERIRRGCELE